MSKTFTTNPEVSSAPRLISRAFGTEGTVPLTDGGIWEFVMKVALTCSSIETGQAFADAHGVRIVAWTMRKAAEMLEEKLESTAQLDAITPRLVAAINDRFGHHLEKGCSFIDMKLSIEVFSEREINKFSNRDKLRQTLQDNDQRVLAQRSPPPGTQAWLN